MKTTQGFIIIFILLFSSCTDTAKNQERKVDENILNGMYEVNPEDSDMTYIWVFSDNKIYNFRAVEENYISYEWPMNYYTIDNDIYICGIDLKMNPISLEDCKNTKIEPYYKIIKIDTVKIINSTEVIYVLEQTRTKRISKLRKIGTP
jgi:hypothetical protein